MDFFSIEEYHSRNSIANHILSLTKSDSSLIGIRSVTVITNELWGSAFAVLPPEQKNLVESRRYTGEDVSGLAVIQSASDITRLWITIHNWELRNEFIWGSLFHISRWGGQIARYRIRIMVDSRTLKPIWEAIDIVSLNVETLQKAASMSCLRSSNISIRKQRQGLDPNICPICNEKCNGHSLSCARRRTMSRFLWTCNLKIYPKTGATEEQAIGTQLASGTIHHDRGTKLPVTVPYLHDSLVLNPITVCHWARPNSVEIVEQVWCIHTFILPFRCAFATLIHVWVLRKHSEIEEFWKSEGERGSATISLVRTIHTSRWSLCCACTERNETTFCFEEMHDSVN